MPRKKRTLKSLEEAQALLAAKPKRRRRSPFQIQKDQEAADAAREEARLQAKGISKELLDSLGVTAATQTPHFLCDGMTSSPFSERPREPLIPYLQHKDPPWTQLDALKESYAYSFWKGQNAKEKEALAQGRPLYQHLCKEWAAPYFEGLNYIDDTALTSPGANGLVYCERVPLNQIYPLWACCPPLERFLRDVGTTYGGALPIRHLLTAMQKKENDAFKRKGLDMQLPFDEYREEYVEIQKIDRSKPYGPGNYEIVCLPREPWIPPDGDKRDRKVPMRRIRKALAQFVFDHGQPAVDLLNNIRTYGEQAALQTVAPLFGSKVPAQTRAAFLGPAELGAEILHTTPELLTRFSQISAFNARADELRQLKIRQDPERNGLPPGTICIRVAWPFLFWEEACPTTLLEQTLQDHIRFHQPWKLPRAEGEAWIGPELYKWLRLYKWRNQEKRQALWDGVRTLLALEATRWWGRDWKDTERFYDKHAFEAHFRQNYPLPKDKDLWDFSWRLQQLFYLLRDGQHAGMPNSRGGAERKTETVDLHRRLMPERHLNLWAAAVRTLGRYAFSDGNVSSDWWLLGSIGQALKDTRNGFSSRDRQARETLQERLETKRLDYEFHAISPDGRTRPAAGQQREDWECAIRTLTRWCAGEAGAYIYFQEPDRQKWQTVLETFRDILRPWLGDAEEGDHPDLSIDTIPFDIQQLSSPWTVVAFHHAMRNRKTDPQWEEEWDRRKAREREEILAKSTAFQERQEAQRKRRFDAFNRRIQHRVDQGMDRLEAQQIEFKRMLDRQTWKAMGRRPPKADCEK